MSSPDAVFAEPGSSPKPAPALLFSRTSMLLLAATACQLAVLGWMIVGTTMMFRNTRTVLLKVEPLDPRDLFRGEYVILDYAFSRVPAEGIAGLPGPYTSENYADWQGRAVFVPLIDDGDGKHFHAGPASVESPPDDAPFLQGTLASESRINFGIEEFFVQEGQGKAYEDAVRDHKLWAEVGLTKHGWSTLQGLKIE